MESLNGSVESVSPDETLDTSKSSTGLMGQREATHQDGTKMSRIEKLLTGKLFEITAGQLVLVVSTLALVAGFMAGIKFDRSRIDVINWEGHTWQLVGMAKDPSGVFIPVYKDSDQIMRALRPSQGG